MEKILARGHSRVPVYSGNAKNIIGLLLIKSLLTIRPESETPVGAVSIRKIPRVLSDMPLYDILNEFQKGGSHMAAVVKAKGKGKGKMTPQTIDGEKHEENTRVGGDSQLTTPLLQKNENIEDGEVIGIITLEDVFEELLQEEIVDETDEYVDVHKRIRVVAAAAAASSMARAPSIRRLTGQKGGGGQSKPPVTPKKSSGEDVVNTTRNSRQG